jgi:hypothetical protein
MNVSHPTADTGEAFALLESAHAFQIATARKIAVDLAASRADREVTIRDVELEMRRRDLIDDESSNYWMGPVFRGKDTWSDTGRWLTLTSPSRKHHGLRPVKVWRYKS